MLMAIDHVRVYSGQPAGGPTPGIFFTRWITHFVAPAFVFLAGTAAYLYGRKVNDTKKLASFLLTRGLWLVFLELTVIRVAWTFNFDFAHYMLAGVIWMIGWCMVLMAGIVFLPRAAILTGSLLVIFGHNTGVLQHLLASGGEESANPIAKILYLGGGFQLGHDGPPLLILFVLIPWIAVMAAGYAFGPIMELDAGAPPSDVHSTRPRGHRAVSRRARNRPLWRSSAAGIGRRRPRRRAQAPAATTQPSAPRPQMPLALAFLNTSKYPASLSFLLMTLGPMLVLLGLVDQAHGPIARALRDIRSRADVLLSVAHPDDPPRRGHRVAGARGLGESVAVRQSSAESAAAAAGLHVESVAAVPRVGDRDRRAVRRVPVVRRRKVARAGRRCSATCRGLVFQAAVRCRPSGIGRRPVHWRQRHVVEPQVHAELPPMMNQMIHQYRS